MLVDSRKFALERDQGVHELNQSSETILGILLRCHGEPSCAVVHAILGR